MKYSLLFALFAISIAQMRRYPEGPCVDKGELRPRGFQCDVPTNLCQVSGCTGYDDKCITTPRPDGAICPIGTCYNGECVKGCAGLCCDHQNKAAPDGYPCGGDMKCYSGACVRPCNAGEECCNEHNFSKANGSHCTDGYCIDGKCMQTRDVEHKKAENNEEQESNNPINSIPIYHNEHKDNLEEKWVEMQKKEEKKEEEAKKQAEKEAALTKELEDTKAEAEVAILQANKTDEKKPASNTTRIVLIALAAGVGLLLVILVVALVVKNSRKKSAKKNDDEFYERT